MNEWGAIKEQQKTALILEIKEFNERKKEFEKYLNEHNECISSKLMNIEIKQQEFIVQNANLLQKAQLITEKEIALRQQESEIKIMQEELSRERQLIEIQNNNNEMIKNKLEEEGNKLRAERGQLSKKNEELESLKNQLIIKEQNYNNQQALIDYDRKVVYARYKTFEAKRHKHLRDRKSVV